MIWPASFVASIKAECCWGFNLLNNIYWGTATESFLQYYFQRSSVLPIMSVIIASWKTNRFCFSSLLQYCFHVVLVPAGCGKASTTCSWSKPSASWRRTSGSMRISWYVSISSFLILCKFWCCLFSFTVIVGCVVERPPSLHHSFLRLMGVLKVANYGWVGAQLSSLLLVA